MSTNEKMKTIITKLLMLTAVLSASTNVYAYDFQVNFIYYNRISSVKKTVEITYGTSSTIFYHGDFAIPEQVTYSGNTYSVIAIGDEAFENCSELTSVTIPNSVTSIGNSAFNGCSELTSVTIPNSVTSIGNSAFQVCSGLESVNISDLSAWCKIDFSDSSSNPLFYADNLYLDGGLITDLTIPDDIIEIKQYTFSGCSSLASVTVPNSVISIGDSAFSGCSGLTSVTIPNNVTTVGRQAFYDCRELKELRFEDGEKRLSIGDSSFSGCSIGTLYLGRDINTNSSTPFGNASITDLTIGKNITTIGDSAFSNCSIESVNISDLSAWCKIYFASSSSNPLYYASNIYLNGELVTDLIIPNDITEIKQYTFSGCSSLASVTIPNSVTSVGDSAFSGCSALSSLTIGDNVNRIGDSAFSGCSSLASVTIPNSVTSVGDSAFSGCSALSSLTIGGSVTTIGNYAFSGCSSLVTATIPNSVTTVGNYAFEDCDNLYSLIIGSGVSQIGEDAANPIKTIWLPNTPPSGYRNANGKVNYVANDLYTALSNVTVYPFISSLFEVDGVRYVPVVPSERSCDAIDCTYNPEISDFDLGNINYLGITMLVQNIQPYTFYRNEKIQNIIIPQNATSVGDYNFDDCTSLKYVTINDRKTELELGSNGSEPLFVSCPLDTVYIGGDISYPTSSGQGYSPFYQNETLEKITIANVENAITEKEFYNCISLKDVSIGDDVEIIGDWAFSGCVVLNNFSFGSSMKEIGEEAFSDCIAMTNIISKATVPPVCGWQALDDINKWNCTLTVPLSAVDSYKAAEQWKEFFFITGEDFDNTSGVKDAVSENGGVSVLTNRNCIKIIGAHNAVITVYNTNGQIVYSGTETTVGGLAQGIYIVSVDGQTFKVAL